MNLLFLDYFFGGYNFVYEELFGVVLCRAFVSTVHALHCNKTKLTSASNLTYNVATVLALSLLLRVKVELELEQDSACK